MTGSEEALTSQPSLSFEKHKPEIAANFPSRAAPNLLGNSLRGAAEEPFASQLNGSSANGDLPVLNMGGVPLTFRQFSEEILNVNKLVVGGDNDPTHGLLQTAALDAPETFWHSAAMPENKDSLESLAKRCRNWISVLLRKGAFDKTLPALMVLDHLPLSNVLINSIGIVPTAKNLSESAQSESVRQKASELVTKYQNAMGNGSAHPINEKGELKDSQPVSSRTPKLFNDHSALNLRTHKRIREKSPPRAFSEPSDVPAETDGSTVEPDRKRAKSKKRVHWKPDAELVAVKLFEMDGIAKFKSSKTARQEEHDEGSAMHPNVEWVTPKALNFSGLFGSEQFRSLMSTRRGGLKEPVSAEVAKSRPESGSEVPPSTNPISDEGPREPPEQDRGPDPSWTPRECGKFTPATPPSDWLQKHNYLHSGMNLMVPQMPPPMMPSFPWAMNYPMNVGISPAQMSEMMKYNNSMFGKR